MLISSALIHESILPLTVTKHIWYDYCATTLSRYYRLSSDKTSRWYLFVSSSPTPTPIAGDCELYWVLFMWHMCCYTDSPLARLNYPKTLPHRAIPCPRRGSGLSSLFHHGRPPPASAPFPSPQGATKGVASSHGGKTQNNQPAFNSPHPPNSVFTCMVRSLAVLPWKHEQVGARGKFTRI